MRNVRVFMLALLVAVAAVGCDTTEEDELTDAEIFVGSWTVVEVSDDDGDKTSVFAQGVSDFSAIINADTYSLLVSFVDPDRQPVALSGDYTVNEGGNNLILEAGPQQLSFSYDIQSENRIRLTLPEAVVRDIFGTQEGTYVGNVTFTVDRVD